MSDNDKLSQSPQEKKEHSYAKDRRNSFGENSKAARKAIPRRKARESRSSRREVAQSLLGIARLDEAEGALVESSARNAVERVGGFKKKTDVPLSEHLQPKQRRVSRRVMAKE